jgi:hypothetical protein
MSWFRKSKNTVTVEFIANGTEIPFAISEVPIEQLPDTFELETDLEIEEQHWKVIQAAPQNKEEFSKTGKLRIILDKIQMMDPREILFSLPTINDEIAETENDSIDNLFVIHEDDWRQQEFVSPKYNAEIRQELSAIAEIYEKHRIGIGFDKIHIRSSIASPLIDKNISIEEFNQRLNITERFDGCGLAGGGKVKNSFAFQIADGTAFYGQTENGLITVLCAQLDENFIQSIKNVAEHYKIVFVDWCRAEVIE